MLELCCFLNYENYAEPYGNVHISTLGFLGEQDRNYRVEIRTCATNQLSMVSIIASYNIPFTDLVTYLLAL